MKTPRDLQSETELLIISKAIDRRRLNTRRFIADPNLLAEALKTARSALIYWARKTGMLTEAAGMRDDSRLMEHPLAATQRVDYTYPAAIDFDSPLNADLLTTDEMLELVPQKKQGRCSGKGELEQAKEFGRNKHLIGHR